MPKVSVIVTCYNVERFLRQCLKSVIRQTLRDIEILPVNDGSTDGTLAIMEDFASRDSRINIVNMPENRGLQWARYEGIKAVKGDWIMIVDGDDYMSADFVEALYNAVVSTGADVACTDSRWTVHRRFPWLKHRFVHVAEELQGKTITHDEFVSKYYPNYIGYSSLPAVTWAYIYNKRLFQNYSPPKYTCTRGQDLIFNFEILYNAQKLTFLRESGRYFYRNIRLSLPHQKNMSRLYMLRYHELVRIFQERGLPLKFTHTASVRMVGHFHEWVRKMIIAGKKDNEIASMIGEELKCPDWKELLSLISDDDHEMTQLVREGDPHRIITYNKRLLPPSWRLWIYRLLNS